jgi:hypothetical protein
MIVFSPMGSSSATKERINYRFTYNIKTDKKKQPCQCQVV